MNILYATDFHNRANSGIAFALNELASHTSSYGPLSHSVHLLSIGETDLPVQQPVRHLKARPSEGLTRLWRFASSYGAMCEDAIKRHNISTVHIHGFWMYPQFAAARAAQRLGVPTVLTNHGAIQWALRQRDVLGATKKRLYMTLMKDRLFRKITVQHAITQLDRDALHSFFPHGRIEIVPNFIDVQKVDRELGSTEERESEPYVLFVGRLHPTKGIDLLIQAFGQAAIPRDWRLIVVGPTVDPSYSHELRRLIAASPKADRIELRGPVWETAQKYRLMRHAWVTALPSHTEVISLVNLEASACFTPTITTKATGLLDWTEGGGVLIDPAIDALASALSDAVRWSDQERKQRGLASRRLVEKRYSSAAVMPRWFDLYRSLY
jgi:glycosyltransferase involved in cell wall biosynthesis